VRKAAVQFARLPVGPAIIKPSENHDRDVAIKGGTDIFGGVTSPGVDIAGPARCWNARPLNIPLGERADCTVNPPPPSTGKTSNHILKLSGSNR
jgi:hypothetical protein